jgi:hypothetical protein
MFDIQETHHPQMDKIYELEESIQISEEKSILIHSKERGGNEKEIYGQRDINLRPENARSPREN